MAGLYTSNQLLERKDIINSQQYTFGTFLDNNIINTLIKLFDDTYTNNYFK